MNLRISMVDSAWVLPCSYRYPHLFPSSKMHIKCYVMCGSFRKGKWTENICLGLGCTQRISSSSSSWCTQRISSTPSQWLRPREEQRPLHVHRHLLRHPRRARGSWPESQEQLLDRLLKDIVTESKKFDVVAFIPPCPTSPQRIWSESAELLSEANKKAQNKDDNSWNHFIGTFMMFKT